MKNIKKLLAFALVLALAFAFAACGSTDNNDVNNVTDTVGTDNTTDDTDTEPVHVKIGATPAPHAEILEALSQEFLDNGVEVEVVEYTDYIIPNKALDEGSIDANYFQHQPYLTSFNEENGTDLVAIASVHYEPYGIYPGKTASIEELPDGAQISVPNDPSNEARALQLLQDAGIITLTEGVGLEATVLDIVDNPKNVEIIEIEAAQLPRSLQDVDLAVINGNYAIEAGLSVAKDAIFAEDKDSEAAQTFANVLAVKAGNESNEALQKVAEVLTSDAAREYMEQAYDGAVVPAF